ncbi:MAG: hypothetical protein B7Y45_07205 [Sphingomonas sp. 28-66-16]|nr:MAG: hypothetical protein B7Y45_07205 [Sphingomonas sp. 28-66-16]
MGKLMARGFLGLCGVMALGLFSLVWFDLPRFGAVLGPVAPSPLAAATLRADAGGFFATWAVGALFAAVQDDRRIALLPMLLLGFAFAGRFYTYLITGDPAIVQPMTVEAVLCGLIGIARLQLGARS